MDLPSNVSDVRGMVSDIFGKAIALHSHARWMELSREDCACSTFRRNCVELEDHVDRTKRRNYSECIKRDERKLSPVRTVKPLTFKQFSRVLTFFVRHEPADVSALSVCLYVSLNSDSNRWEGGI